MSDRINYIEANYQTTQSIEQKTTEQLKIEINVKYHQAEELAGLTVRMLSDAGKRLIEVKNRIPHGRFEDWCKDNLEFSKSKAEKMMKIAEKIGDEKSIFSKTETFTDLRISTVWALLAAPEDVAEEVVNNNDISELTIRELKEELARVKEEHQHEIEDIQNKMEFAREPIASSVEQELEDALNAAKHMKQELKSKEHEKNLAIEQQHKAHLDLKKAKEKLKSLKSEQDLLIEQAVKEEANKVASEAKEKAKAEVEEELKNNAAEIKMLEEQIEVLESEKAKLSNTALIEFKVYVDALQDAYFKTAEIIKNQMLSDEDTAKKMQEALQKIIKTWGV